ncbi:MAG: cupin domain-containing protein [Myxococcales bacterium]|nr:cupin domain-containing protein [Myxococcales bacterium]
MKAHLLEGNESLSAEQLTAEGIFAAVLPTEEQSYRAEVDRIKGERGYIQEDIVELSPDTPGLDAICAKFLDEHHHDEDEVRFVLSGEGIFDIRDSQDRYMRVKVEQGDMIVVPAGRHHRFLLTESKAIRCVRLFKDPSGWVAHYR